MAAKPCMWLLPASWPADTVDIRTVLKPRAHPRPPKAVISPFSPKATQHRLLTFCARKGRGPRPVMVPTLQHVQTCGATRVKGGSREGEQASDCLFIVQVGARGSRVTHATLAVLACRQQQSNQVSLHSMPVPSASVHPAPGAAGAGREAAAAALPPQQASCHANPLARTPYLLPANSPLPASTCL